MSLARSVVGWGSAAAALAVAAAGCIATDSTPAPNHQRPQVQNKFWNSRTCGNCHTEIYAQHSGSMHAKAFENPVFQTQFYEHYLPLMHDQPTEYANEPSCLACHAPIAYLDKGLMLAKQRVEDVEDPDCENCHVAAQQTGDVDPLQDQSLGAPGVACDICHRIEGYRGMFPGNGNYIAKPGVQKFGPFKHKSDWHHVYGELQTKSEFCAICHNSVNRLGVPVRTTFTEWQRSQFAKDGIQCQDCHMTLKGYLVDGKPVYDSGKAAHMTLGTAPDREKLYTHRFPGAHNANQISDALVATIEARSTTVSAGEKVRLKVLVDNSKAGHKVPSGSVELRAVFLDLTAKAGEREIPVRLSGQMDTFAVIGGGEWDTDVYGDTLPRGRRIYRAVFVDASGKQTLLSFDAKDRVFDNRLEAGEVRPEFFYLDVPGDLHEPIEVTATLAYLRFPLGFAKKIGVDPVEPVHMSSRSLTLQVE